METGGLRGATGGGWTRFGRPALLSVPVLILLAVLGPDPSGGSSRVGAETGQPRNAGAAYGEMVGPCASPEGRAELRCPDLRMRRPFDLWFSRSARGRLLLHAANDIQSRGAGPLEVRGRRTKPNARPKWMEAHQVIHRRGPGKVHRPPTASLTFHPIPYQGSYWKYADAARFEMWALDPDGRATERVRVGPKLDYCFRDLERTEPSRSSPRRRVYPACSQNPSQRRVTLGTSVGWSDVYPSTYDDNFIDVTGLRGCFLFRQLADPENQLSELSESNNTGQRRVRLTGKPTRIRPC